MCVLTHTFTHFFKSQTITRLTVIVSLWLKYNFKIVIYAYFRIFLANIIPANHLVCVVLFIASVPMPILLRILL